MYAGHRFALLFVASGLACGDPDGADDTGEETGDDLMCDVAEPPALSTEPGRREPSLVARVADIPGIAEQPTDAGQRIGALSPHLGRIHLGYGDYDQNTGPISMVSYVPADATFETHGVVSAEEVQRFLTHAGELYTANIDPRGHEYDGSVFRLDTACGEWEEALPIDGAVHAYALVSYRGRIWVGTGSLSGAPGLVMSSDDGGRSWREELSIDSPPGSFTRVLDGAAVGDTMLFTGRSYPTEGDTNFAWQRQGDTWSPVEGVPDVSRVVPLAFADAMVIIGWSGDVGKSGGVTETYALEGDALVPHAWFPAGFAPINWHVAPPRPDDPPWLWVLGRQGGETIVTATADLESWETIAVVPPFDDGDPRALAYDANEIYLGSSNGDLHVVAEIFAPP